MDDITTPVSLPHDLISLKEPIALELHRYSALRADRMAASLPTEDRWS